jgi:hypothetical protein
VGSGTDPDGNTEAWRAFSPTAFSSVPEPSGGELEAATLAVLSVIGRSKRARSAAL